MSAFTVVPLQGDLTPALAGLPAKPGVGQIVGPEGRNLLIGRPANLRQWAGQNLGRARPVAKGRRPPTDLSSIATAIGFAETTSGFHQRLLFERLMDRHVPREKRRDLKTPGFLRLDRGARFPRVVTVSPGPDLEHAYGPFRDRRAAERAREALQKVLRLRPCDYEFEPDPQLPLGLGCLFAQVRSCAAPCLARVDEGEYRALAARAADALGGGERTGELAAALPFFVAAAGSPGLVAASNPHGVELYPVRGGRVREERRLDVATAPDGPEAAALVEEALDRLGGLEGGADPEGADDRPWLLAWLAAPRRGGSYLVEMPGESRSALAARVCDALRPSK